MPETKHLSQERKSLPYLAFSHCLLPPATRQGNTVGHHGVKKFTITAQLKALNYLMGPYCALEHAQRY